MFLLNKLLGKKEKKPEQKDVKLSVEEELYKFKIFLAISFSYSDPALYYQIAKEFNLNLPTFEESALIYMQDPFVMENTNNPFLARENHLIIYKICTYLIEIYGPEFEIKGQGTLLEIITKLINFQENRF